LTRAIPGARPLGALASLMRPKSFPTILSTAVPSLRSMLDCRSCERAFCAQPGPDSTGPCILVAVRPGEISRQTSSPNQRREGLSDMRP
jgi:hypothetical protein